MTGHKNAYPGSPRYFVQGAPGRWVVWDARTERAVTAPYARWGNAHREAAVCEYDHAFYGWTLEPSK